MKQYKYICNKCGNEVLSAHPHDMIPCKELFYNTKTGYQYCYGICERQYIELLEYADFEPVGVN